MALRGEDAERLTWRRGFVEGVKCRAVEWLRVGLAVRTRNPVQRVVLSHSGEVTRDDWLAGIGALRGLCQVDLKHAPFGALVPAVGRGTELAEWLRERLPGTRVNMETGSS